MDYVFMRTLPLVFALAISMNLFSCGKSGKSSGEQASSNSSISISSSSRSTSSSSNSSGSSTTNPSLSSGGVASDVIVINGVAVPPDPGSAAKSTLAGVDTNFNGVRDEVERELAAYFGKVPAAHTAALEFARKLQAPLSNPITTSEDATTSVTAELIAFECFAAAFYNREKALDAANVIAARSYNTKKRVTEHTGVYDLSGLTELPEIGVPSCN